MITEALERLGLRRPRGSALTVKEEPVLNDGDRNLPTVLIIRGRDYYYRSNGGGGYAPFDTASWQYYQTLAAEGYGRNSDVYACISLIANAAMQVKWWDDSNPAKSYSLKHREFLSEVIRHSNRLTRKQATYPGRAYSAGEKAEIVRRASNPRASIELLTQSGGAAFIDSWISTLLIYGNVFVEIEPGSTLRLHMLRPETVQPVRRLSSRYEDVAGGGLEHWTVSVRNGQPRIVKVENMMHSKMYSPFDPIMGMAPLQAAMLRVTTQNESVENMRRTLKRGNAPGWIELAPESEWSDEQIAALKQRAGASRTNNEELILQNGRWHEMGIKPSDTEFAEAHLLTKRDIASVYHVDPALIGDTTGRTYATYRESRRGLYMEAVIPDLTVFRDDWNRTIGAILQSPLEFDKDSFDAIASAREEATDRVEKLFKTGLIDRSEARSDLAYDPVPGDDGVFYSPATFVEMPPPGSLQTEDDDKPE